MTTAENILQKIDDFKTLPTVYTALMKALGNPHSSTSDIASIISSDQAASVKVLKAANSPLYGYSGKVDTISKAIMYVGLAEVKNLVAALTIIEMFSQTTSSHFFNPIEFWKYSIAVGVISRAIARKESYTGIENYFLAGVLHDLGKLLLYQCAPSEFIYSQQVAAARKIPLRDAMHETLGIPYNELGEHLAERWNMPASICAVIRYSHTGMNNNKRDTLVATVHIASFAAQKLKLGSSSEKEPPPPSIDALETLNLSCDVFTQMHSQIIQDYIGAVSLLQL